jgi:hypothetical protein
VQQLKIRRVGGQHGHAAGLQATQDRRLLARDRLDASQVADMRRRDCRDHRDVRTGEAGERSDLAWLVHADLGDVEPRVLGQARQGERHAPMVVVGGDRRVGARLRGERGAQHLLGRGLADAAGDRGEAAGEARPPGGAEAGQAG